MKNYKRSIKNFGKGLKGGAICFAGVSMLATPFTTPLGIAAMTKGVNDIYGSIQGDYIKNSMMSIQTNKKLNKLLKRPANYIVEGLPSISQFMGAYLTENKMDFLSMQEVNLFLQLASKDKDGNDIEYNTTTHAGNYKMLKELEKSGLIEGLQKTYIGQKSLKMERLFLGNSNAKQMAAYKKKRREQIRENVASQKGIVNKFKTLKEELDIGIDKKTKMYSISFKKSDRTFSEQELCGMLNFVTDGNGTIDQNRFATVKDKDGNITSIAYKKGYVLDMFRERSKKLGQRIMDKAKEKKNKWKEDLKDMTVDIAKIPIVTQDVGIQEVKKEIDNVR